MMPEQRGWALMLEIAQTIGEPRSLAGTMEAIVATAARCLPVMHHVGITIAVADGTLQTTAATDRFVREVDQLQYDLGEGPCVQTVREEPVTMIEYAHLEQRWPQFMPTAVEKGIRSLLGLRLYADKATFGGLNLYSTSVDTIDAQVGYVARALAVQASLALGRAQREEQLQLALLSRTVVGQAVGILMEHYDMDEEAAFSYLTRVSSHSNVKVRELAKQLVEQRKLALARSPCAPSTVAIAW